MLNLPLQHLNLYSFHMALKKVNLYVHCTTWTINDVPWKDLLKRPRGGFTVSEGYFHVKNSYKLMQWLERSEAVKNLGISPRDISKGSLEGSSPEISLTYHCVFT